MEDSIALEGGEAPYDPAAAAKASVAITAGRGRGRGRGRGGGGIAIAGIAELDASMGRGGAPPGGGRGAGPPAVGAGSGKPFPPKKAEKDFRGPEGLFKKGDWTCTVCGNVNWERRQTCNKCQNQKPNIANGDEVSQVYNVHLKSMALVIEQQIADCYTQHVTTRS